MVLQFNASREVVGPVLRKLEGDAVPISNKYLARKVRGEVRDALSDALVKFLATKES